MTVKQMIEILQEQDQGLDVFIQQGEFEDYMFVYTVREEIITVSFVTQAAVVIEYT